MLVGQSSKFEQKRLKIDRVVNFLVKHKNKQSVNSTTMTKTIGTKHVKSKQLFIETPIAVEDLLDVSGLKQQLLLCLNDTINANLKDSFVRLTGNVTTLANKNNVTSRIRAAETNIRLISN